MSGSTSFSLICNKTKMVFKLTLLFALFAVSLAGPSYNAHVPAPSGPVQYNFNYAVNDNFGNDFGHQENRNGYDTQGTYYVQLPDGRLQKVTYAINGDSGYIADVSYQGEAQYPSGSFGHAPSQSYQHAPSPAYG